METSVREAVSGSLRGLRLMDFDWDGAKGLPMRGDVADTAMEIFANPEIFPDDLFWNLPLPTVTLNGNGTVETAFDGEDGRQLLVTFECEGVVTYVKVFPDDQTTIEGVIRLNVFASSMGHVNPADFAELADLLGWVSDGRDGE